MALAEVNEKTTEIQEKATEIHEKAIEIHEKKDLLEACYEEIKRLRSLIATFEGYNIEDIYEELRRLNERVVVLERERQFPEAAPLQDTAIMQEEAPVAVEPEAEEDEHVQYSLEDDAAERERKRKEKQERKLLRQRIRLATALGEDIAAVRRRIEELEKLLQVKPPPPPVAAPPAPPASTVPTTTAPEPKNSGYASNARQELNSLRLQNAALTAELDRLRHPTATADDVSRLEKEVKYLTVRLEYLVELLKGFPEGRPKYVPTYVRVWRSCFGNKYDGNYPWLLTARLHKLSQENAQLQERMVFVKNDHVAANELLEAKFQPILSENTTLRMHLEDFKVRNELLQAQLDKYKAEQGSGLLGFNTPFLRL